MRFISRVCARERGVITIAETLIVLGIATAALLTWALNRNQDLTIESARHTGKLIAAYSRASAEWLANSPPTTAGDFGVANLQDCADPSGARFLSCNIPANTRIPFAFDTNGLPLTMADLVIRVTLGTDGPTGDIDFGVIRSGQDADGDGLPDARPDIAAIAHRTATEDTGAGVSDFFELRFARSDPTGLVFNPTNPAFDQAALDELAQLFGRVGARVDAPFLRVDGTNEMQAGITFDNGVIVNPDGSDLEITGPGDFVVNTATGTMRSAMAITAPDISGETLSAATTLTVNPVDGVRGDGFNRLDQSQEVVDNRRDINANEISIATNETNIINNTNRIRNNETNIARNSQNIATNTQNIAANRTAIQTNRNNISALNTKVASNTLSIDRLNKTPDPPTPPANCVPTLSTVQAQLRPYVSSCSSVLDCARRCSQTARTQQKSATYYIRNLSTLACESRTLSVYTQCCLTSGGNCDGWCEHGAARC